MGINIIKNYEKDNFFRFDFGSFRSIQLQSQRLLPCLWQFC